MNVTPDADRADGPPAPEPTPRPGRFARRYGASPAHLIGHLALIAVSAFLLSILFQARFAPQPINLALWLLGGAVLHDAVFLPAYGVANALFSRWVGAGDQQSLKSLAAGPPVEARRPVVAPVTAADAGSASRDGRRAVPIVNHIRTPSVVSAVLFLVFLPRILDRQPQNFVNALGHAPPDFFARWLVVTGLLFAASAVLYAVRRARAHHQG